jgi:Domain of unknown function (DUF4149)
MLLRPVYFRVGAVLCGMWAGVLVGIAALGTRAGFALAPTELAGKLAGYMLEREAYLSLALCAVLFFFVRQQARAAAKQTGGSVMSANVLLVLAALFCTVLGHFVLQPAMVAARAGQGVWSFGALHAVSLGCFGIKALLVTTLAWRFSGG